MFKVCRNFLARSSRGIEVPAGIAAEKVHPVLAAGLLANTSKGIPATSSLPPTLPVIVRCVLRLGLVMSSAAYGFWTFSRSNIFSSSILVTLNLTAVSVLEDGLKAMVR
ncbi:hypothetical protein D9M68_878370 [compost metagenome]